MTRNRPSIYQVGRVDDDGTTVVIHGWGLGLCAPRCHCHRHPTAGHLTILEDHTLGTVGLVSHVTHPPCGCCQPWTADELAAVIRDLAAVAALETA